MLHRLKFTVFLAAALLAGGGAAARAQQAPERFDLLISGGAVVDGTGASARTLDVGIRGDRVVALAPALPRAGAGRVLDATGRVVAPGFIDIRTDPAALLAQPLAESALRQGVTLAVGGLGGKSPYPLRPFLDSLRAAGSAINTAFLVGHNDVRLAVLGLGGRQPGAAELARMQALVAEGMGEGAFGLGTGLADLPGLYSGLDELVALARVAADSGGFYSTELRDEGSGLVSGVREALEVGRRAGVPVLLGSHKAVGPAAWGLSALTLALVDSARLAGTDVMLDQYPYAATRTGIDSLMPEWALSGGKEAYRKRLADPALADSMLGGLVANILARRGGTDLERVQFTGVSWDTRSGGKTLTQLAECRNLEPVPENGARVLLDAVLSDSGAAVYPVLDEQDVLRIMGHPFTMIASAGRLSRSADAQAHPRSFGTFPRVLGAYVRESAVLTLEAAIHKATQLPATRLGLTDRGVLRVGAYADVVVFDPGSVADRATFAEPDRYPVGVETVVVNGVLAVANGEVTGQRPGRVLTRSHAGSTTSATPLARSARPAAAR